MSICEQYSKILLSKYTSIFLPHNNLCLYVGILLDKKKKENFPTFPVWRGPRIWFTYKKARDTTKIQVPRKKSNQILPGYGKSYFKRPATWYSRIKHFAGLPSCCGKSQNRKPLQDVQTHLPVLTVPCSLHPLTAPTQIAMHQVR